MSKTVPGFYVKLPDEEIDITISFEGALTTGTSIISGTVTSTNEADDSDSTSTIIGTPSFQANAVVVRVKAGNPGEIHNVDVKVNLNSTEKRHEWFKLVIEEQAEE